MKTFREFIKEQALDGIAASKTVDDFYGKYGATEDAESFKVRYNQKIAQGIKVEMEHTKDEEVAKKITLDHLWEDIEYYNKLERCVEQVETDVKQPEAKRAVLSYGRFNPPTIAHEKLIKKLSAEATSRNADAFLIPSHTGFYTAKTPKAKMKNPLTIEEKIDILTAIAPPNVIVTDAGATYIAALQYLMTQGYTDIVQIAGSDRITEFQGLEERYNGKPAKDGTIPFQFNSFEFASSGARDPDSEGITGMSASKIRDLAANSNYEGFIKGMPTKIQDNPKMLKDIYNAIRERQV